MCNSNFPDSTGSVSSSFHRRSKIPQNRKREKRTRKSTAQTKIYRILLGIMDPNHQTASEKQLEVKTTFSTCTQTKQYFHNWEVCNLFYASFHVLLRFLCRDESEIQCKTTRGTPWKRINSLQTATEWTLFQTNTSDICVRCYFRYLRAWLCSKLDSRERHKV